MESQQMILLKIFNYRYNSLLTILLILMTASSSTFANNHKLLYVFNFKPDGLHIKSCLRNANKNLLWLLPKLIENNKKHQTIKIETSQNNITLLPRYDYAESANALGENVCISYILEYGSNWYNGYFHEVNKKSFLIFGNHSLPIPDFKEKDKDILDIEFIWKNFNQPIVSTFGDFTSNITLTVKPIAFNSLYFSSGYNKLANDNKGTKLLFQPHYKNIIENLNQRMLKIVHVVDNYFNIANSINNTVIFVQSEKVYFDNPGFALSDNKNFLQVIGLKKKQIVDSNLIYTMAHEYFHKVIGYLIKIDPQNQNNDYWFLEGFTDYFSTKIALEIGIWNIDDYLKFYNKRIYKYFAYRMQKHKITDLYGKYIYDDAGYIVGMMYAHKIDSVIKINSGGKLNLLDFLKLFISEISDKHGSYFSMNLFLNQLYHYSLTKFEDIELFRKGKDLLSKSILDNSLCLTMKTMYVPNYEVDLFKLVKELKIHDRNIISIKEDCANEYIHHIEFIDSNRNIHTAVLRPFFTSALIPQYIKCSH